VRCGLGVARRRSTFASLLPPPRVIETSAALLDLFVGLSLARSLQYLVVAAAVSSCIGSCYQPRGSLVPLSRVN